jgi:hypothetical protein
MIAAYRADMLTGSRILLALVCLLALATSALAEGAWVAWVHSAFRRPRLCEGGSLVVLGPVYADTIARGRYG